VSAAARRRLVTLVAMASLVALAGGLLLVRAGASPRGPRTVELVMRHSHFTPATLTASPGETVTFVIRNDDPIDHEFIVGDAAVQARHEVGRERHHHGEVPGEVSVPAGAERRTTFRFPGPGSMQFACHLPGHYAYGMHGLVRITG
jgi:uncharacterized cupredoxin-like copper-binding protein